MTSSSRSIYSMLTLLRRQAGSCPRSLFASFFNQINIFPIPHIFIYQYEPIPIQTEIIEHIAIAITISNAIYSIISLYIAILSYQYINMNLEEEQPEQQEQQQQQPQEDNNLNPIQLIDGDNPPINDNNLNENDLVDNNMKASTHFNVTNAVLLFYSMLKLIALVLLFIAQLYFPFCSSFTLRWGSMISLQKWVILIAVHSLISMVHYFLLVNWMSKEANRKVVAVKLGEIVQAEPQNEQRMTVMEESKKISILSMQIKYEVQKSNICGKWMGRISFVFFQFLFIWGMYLFFLTYDTALGCDRYYLHYMTCILFLAIYQYIDFYIILILAVLCSPFLVIFLIYYCISLQGVLFIMSCQVHPGARQPAGDEQAAGVEVQAQCSRRRPVVLHLLLRLRDR